MYNDKAPVRNKIYGGFTLISAILILASAFWILYETHDANANAQINFIPRSSESSNGFRDLVRIIHEDVVQFWSRFPIYTRLILCESIAIIVGLLLIMMSIWLFHIHRGSDKSGKSYRISKIFLDVILLIIIIAIGATIGPITSAFMTFLIVCAVYLILSFVFIAFLRF